MKIKVSVFLGALLFVGAWASATTVVVGSCRPKFSSYPTITQALSGAPAGSIILVCPGSYPEQITISKAVNIQGVVDGNDARAVIVVPAGTPASPGLQVNVTSQFTGVFLGGDFPFAAQVLVQTQQPVFIQDITVDGSGGDQGCPTSGIWLAGIFDNNSYSLVLNRVTTRNQLDEGCGNGIWIEDTTVAGEAVTVENSSVHDFDYAGILAGTNGLDSWLSANIKGNDVFSGAGSCKFYGCGGIASDFVSGTVGANIVTGGSTGIFNLSSAPLTTIKNNWVADTGTGISTGYDGGTVQHNEISNTSTAIDLASNDAFAFANGISNTNIAIEFNCNTDVVGSNTINDAGIGWDNVPSGTGVVGLFDNVDTIVTDCGLSGAKKRVAAPQMRLAFSQNVN